MSTPTQRTLKTLREAGWLAEVVEHWNPFSKTRHDLYGWIDIVAIRQGQTLGLQVTTDGNAAARQKKMLALDTLDAWLAAGNMAQLWGWKKRKNRWHYKKRRFIPNRYDSEHTVDVYIEEWEKP
jgi:hypothetical protein